AFGTQTNQRGRHRNGEQNGQNRLDDYRPEGEFRSSSDLEPWRESTVSRTLGAAPKSHDQQ
ncbi:hypothetical protein, partial [Mesorhizobium sp.]|uniref:hypothetical protein n=1 Tax=Mesorhizobium sp. TaxID=1871066 RepID=UPI0025F68406